MEYFVSFANLSTFDWVGAIFVVVVDDAIINILYIITVNIELLYW